VARIVPLKRNIFLIAEFEAPIDLRTPIIVVRSKIITNKPEIILKDATIKVIIKITITFISDKDSQSKIIG